MARSKKPKRLKQRRTAFFEAMPAAFTPPAALPEVSEQLVAGAHALSGKWRMWRNSYSQIAWRTLAKRVFGFAIHALHKLYVNLLHTGLDFSNLLGHQLKGGAIAVRYSTDAAIRYTPSAAADLRAYAGRTRRALTGRRARYVYVSLAVTGGIIMVFATVVTAASVLTAYANDISSPTALLSKKKTGTTILDRNGHVLFEGYGGQVTKVTPLQDVPKSLVAATLASEDPDFYSHPGFSWRGTTRAAWVDITHRGTVEGGSTLTQQLVKNALLNSDRNFSRKYQELLLSMELEHRYSKDQILEMYLNEIYYGQGASGMEAASQTYFHKSVGDLTLGESALLAGLPLGPSRFDPNRDIEQATGRRNFVLSRMQELGKITKADADTARSQPIQLAAAGAPDHAAGNADPMLVYAKTVHIEAPHFVFYVLDQLRRQYGDDVVEQGGITVRTTLDLGKQHIGEKAVSDHISALTDHHVTNGGLVSLTPTTGDILAMVGSVEYNAPGFGNVNVTMSELQPGSSFKPIAYATAFKKGWNGSTQVLDAPLVLPNGDGSLYIPQNYDGRFHGNVTLRHALDNSLNIPAIKVLQFAGVHDTIQTAHDLGVTSLNEESRYGLSLVLGGGEVRPIDMATVYATLAAGGNKTPPRAILQVSDRHGRDITKPAAVKTQKVLDPRIAYMLTNILSDNQARQPEFPPVSPLVLSHPSAAKTGTTNDFRDNWTVGYTPQIVTAVWVGNNDHTPMANVDGITGAAPIWHDYMEGALAGAPVLSFTPPPGVTLAKVCADGGLANPWDSGYDEVFWADAMPTKHCSSAGPRVPLAQPEGKPAPESFPTNDTAPPPEPPTPAPETPKITPHPPAP
jgi:1A family penicillin-binding protein